MLRTRVLTGLILGALLLLGLFLLPPFWAVLAFGLVFTIGAWEWAGFGALRKPLARALYTLIIALALALSWRWTDDSSQLIILLSAACAWWVIAFFWLSLAPAWNRPALTLVCGLAVLAPAFVALARLQISGGGFARGPLLVLWLVLMVCAADIGAYFAGRAFGRRKLAPRVSPGKTWEGAVGGLAMVALVAAGGALYFGLPPLIVIVFGGGVGIFSVIGDLTESMFKRAAALKDSGTLLPGHGGLLDRIDSVTAAAPLYALGLFGSGVIR
ncbi:MAG TPA: phosphatidate cytidylyltransferase [Steroidobacteraceae bacterium]|jgi:phosphatidate cytidylyltransferase|nr:phosphatidate cytidylyltransferase [Steroidobacteraceae bacterium]